MALERIAVRPDGYNAPIIDAGFTMALGEERFKTRHLHVGQPEQIDH